MTREEIKIAASRDREIKIAASNYVEENSVNGYEALSSHRDSFIEGAEWADMYPVNVWHDASEFPNKALPIIIEIDDDIEPSYEVISIDEKDEKFWEFLVSDRDITIWAYVKDLLPKGGEL